MPWRTLPCRRLTPQRVLEADPERWGRHIFMAATIYHNPACGTSRNVLALIRHAGIEPEIIDYIANPPSRSVLAGLIASAGLTVRQALREKGTPYGELGLSDPAMTDDALLDAMLAHPILINRPFVVTPLGVRLARPSEVVLEILPVGMRGPFVKEDGEPVLDARGNRVFPDSGDAAGDGAQRG